MKKLNKFIAKLLMCSTLSMILSGCNMDNVANGVAIHTNSNELYVATTGDDRNPGTFERPFKTIERARDEVRKTNDDMVNDITVYIQGGTYVQENTLQFTQEDSGTNGHMVTYKAYNNEPVVISGGKELTGWEVFDEEEGIYKAEFEEEVDTRQIYVNGKRAVRARSKGGLSSVTLDPGVSAGAFGMSASNIDMAEWKNIDNIELAFKSAWTNPKCGVESIQLDPNNSNKILIEMKQPGWNSSRNKGHSSVKSGPVFIENAYELLDEPGEWYLDKTGSIGGEPYTFYYKPIPGEDMGTAEVIVPMLEELMVVESNNIDNPVSNIQFQGIAFQYATWLRPNGPNGHSDAQNNYIREMGKDDRATGGNVVVNGARNIIFNSCEFSHMGNVGLYLEQGNKDNLIMGCHFYDISAQAIQIGDVDFSDPKNFYLPHPNKNLKPGDEGYYTQEDWDFRYLQSNNDILNNIIHDVAVEYYSAAAIGTGVVEETDISHNEIYNVPYSGLHVGYGWTSWKDMISPMGNNKIQYNYIHNVMQILNDGGAIYLIGMQQGASGPDGWERKSIISHNYLKDQHNQYGSIYLDEGANYYDVYKNVIDTTPTWLLSKHKQNYMHDNYSNQTNYKNHQSPWESGVATIENTTYVQGNNFPQEAQEIINSTGVQEGFEHHKFECNMAKGELIVESTPGMENEMQIKATYKNLMGVKDEDYIQFFMAGEMFKDRMQTAEVEGQVLSGVGDEMGNVYFGEPIQIKEIEEILSRDGVQINTMINLPEGKSDVAVGLVKVSDGQKIPILSQTNQYYQYSNYEGYEHVLDVDLDKYEIGNITPTSNNPCKINFDPNMNTTLSVEELDSDRVIKFNKFGNSNKSFVANIPFKATTKGNVVVKAKIKMSQTNAKVYGISVADQMNRGLVGVTLLHDGRIVHEEGDMQYVNLMPYTTNTWYDMMLVLDMENGTYDTVINNQLVRESGKFNAASDKQVANVTFGMYSGHKGSYYLKDIDVYASIVPRAELKVETINNRSGNVELDINAGNGENINTQLQGQYRITLGEKFSGSKVAFTWNNQIQEVSVNEKGEAYSPAFNLEDFPIETPEGMRVNVKLPLEPGFNNVRCELLYLKENTELVLDKKDVVVTVIPNNYEDVLSMDLGKYQLGEITDTVNNPYGMQFVGLDQAAVSVEDNVDGRRAIKVNKYATGSLLSIEMPIDISKEYVEISASIKPLQTGTAIYTLKAYGDNDNKELANVNNHLNGQFSYQVGPNHYNIGPYAANKWYDIKMIIDCKTQQYSILVDDEVKADRLAFTNRVSDVTQFSTGIWRNSRGGYYIRDIQVSTDSDSDQTLEVVFNKLYELNLEDYVEGDIYTDTNNDFGIELAADFPFTIVEENGEKAILLKADSPTTTGSSISVEPFPITTGSSISVNLPVQEILGDILHVNMEFKGEDAIQENCMLHFNGHRYDIPYNQYQWNVLDIWIDNVQNKYKLTMNDKIVVEEEFNTGEVMNTLKLKIKNNNLLYLRKLLIEVGNIR